jgi:hypothetical protein
VAVFKLADGQAAPSKMQVRSPASASKPFAGQDRRGGVAQGTAARSAPKPSPAAKPASKPAQIVAVKPAPAKAAPAPKAAAEDDWETF